MSNYFVYTGNAYPHKNLERLIEAVVMARVNLKIISARNAFTERLEKLIKKNGAQHLVEILGYVEDRKLKDIYKNSTAFVFPTLEEGFGLPPMEAINLGTWALVSDIPVLEEVYGKSVMYFDPYDVNSIAEALRKVSEIPEKEKERLVKDSQQFLKKYSWFKMAKETLKVYNSVHGI